MTVASEGSQIFDIILLLKSEVRAERAEDLRKYAIIFEAKRAETVDNSTLLCYFFVVKSWMQAKGAKKYKRYQMTNTSEASQNFWKFYIILLINRKCKQSKPKTK